MGIIGEDLQVRESLPIDEDLPRGCMRMPLAAGSFDFAPSGRSAQDNMGAG